MSISHCVGFVGNECSRNDACPSCIPFSLAYVLVRSTEEDMIASDLFVCVGLLQCIPRMNPFSANSSYIVCK